MVTCSGLAEGVTSLIVHEIDGDNDAVFSWLWVSVDEPEHQLQKPFEQLEHNAENQASEPHRGPSRTAARQSRTVRRIR
jgi:hypothetical protein